MFSPYIDDTSDRAETLSASDKEPKGINAWTTLNRLQLTYYDAIEWC
jgi:hypothetical protein